MKNLLLSALITFSLTLPALGQGLPPTTVPSRRPTLKRDRTLSVLLPKIIQFEDERTPTNELLDMVSPLSGYNGAVRKRAILALGRIGYPIGVTALMDVLKADRTPEFRALAAFSLGEIESQYAVALLMEKLDSEGEKSMLVRARAVEALGKIAANKISAEALGRYGLTGIAETLARLLPDPSKPLDEETKMLTAMTLTALLRLKQPSVVPAVASQLRSPDAEVRWQAANALARIRENVAPAAPLLLEALEDKEPLVRAHAARALGNAKDVKALAPLAKLLSDKDERVVASAITALGALGDTKAVQPLLDFGTKLLEGYRAYKGTKPGLRRNKITCCSL